MKIIGLTGYGGALIGSAIVGIFMRSAYGCIIVFVLATGILCTINGFYNKYKEK